MRTVTGEGMTGSGKAQTNDREHRIVPSGGVDRVHEPAEPLAHVAGARGAQRSLVAAVLVAGTVCPVGAATASIAQLDVTLTGIEQRRGVVRLALYADPEHFDAREPFAVRTLPVDASSTLESVFDDVPTGEYALLAYHDLDGDGVLDLGRFGIPVEPWTGSTTGLRFRAPTWSAYAFELSGDALRIRLEL